jgi:hypothetical protein
MSTNNTFNHNIYYSNLSVVFNSLSLKFNISSNINQQCIINNHIDIIHHNLCGNPNGRKPRNGFLIYQRIHSLEAQLPNSPAATGRRLQPPIYRLQPEGSYNSLNFLAPTRRRLQPPDFRIQPEGSSNSLSSLTPTGRRLQPPFLAPSCCPEI